MARHLQESFAHVRWIGGASCVGKTTIAEHLATAHGLALYHCDQRFDDHASRVDRDRHTNFHSIMSRSCEELWMRPVAAQVAELRGFYEEEFDMVLEDLARLRDDGPVLAEGAGLLPAKVCEVIPDPALAVWLQTASELRCRRARRRPQTPQLLAQCRDPDEAFRRWMKRDDRYAAEIAAEAQSTGSRMLRVDGRRSEEETAAEVADALGLL